MSDIADRIVEKLGRVISIGSLKHMNMDIVITLSSLQMRKDSSGDMRQIYQAYLNMMSRITFTDADGIIKRVRYDFEILSYAADLYVMFDKEAYQKARITYNPIETPVGPVRRFYRDAIEGNDMTV